MRIFAFVLLLLPAAVFCQEYYVSVSGDDAANNGLSVSSPFRTVQKAASVMAAGDVCLIRGGVYRETVRPANSGAFMSPITFMAYSGESVTITGADVLAGPWSPYSGQIYSAPASLPFIQLFIDGSMANEARWPNADPDDPVHMTRAAAGAGTDSNGIYCAALPAGNWAGAYVHITPGYEWSSCTRQIASYSPGSYLSFAAAVPGNGDTNYIPKPGNPFWIFGTLAGLDSEREWFLDDAADTLYVWVPGGGSPAAHTVEVKQRDYGFDLSGRAHITVRGVSLFACAVSMQDSSYCSVENCSARYVDHFRFPDIYADRGGRNNYMSGHDNTWKDSFITYSAGCGLFIQGTHNSVINCVIREAAYMADYQGCISMDGGSANTPSTGHVISGNTLYNSGRFILWYPNSNNLRMEYNDASNGALLTKDCGLFYSYGLSAMDNEICYNWAHDISATYGSGIYLDNGTNHTLVHHNVIWNCAESGIVFNTPSQYNGAFNNTIMNTSKTFSYWGSLTYGLGDPEDMTGTEVANNNADMAKASFASKYPPYVHHNALNPVNGDFTLPYGSAAIDAGAVKSGVTDGYSGAAPDINAYEYGASYWVPGYKQPSPTATAGGPSPTSTPTATITMTTTITPTFIPGNMIDDFSDGNTVNLLSGTWYTYSDPGTTASMSVVPPGYGGAGYCLYVSGTVINSAGGTEYPYFAFGSDLNGPDYTACLGIRFKIKGNNRYISIKLIPQTSVNTGYNDYKYTVYAQDGWQVFQVPFSAFTQEPAWGTIVPLSTVLSSLRQINLQTAEYPRKGTQAYNEFYLDDLEVYGCGLATPTATPTATTVIPLSMIDNCEDGNGTNLWGGYWYTFDDNTQATPGVSVVWPVNGSFTMSAPGFESAYCMRMTGTVKHMAGGYAYPFVAAGTDLGGIYDLTSCTGIKFRYKTDGKAYYVKVSCDDSVPTGYNYYRFTLPASTSWTELLVPFSSMTQASGWGTSAAAAVYFAKSKGVQFQTDSFPAAGAQWDVDLSMDELQVYGCPGVPALTATPTVTATFTATLSATISPQPTSTLTLTVTPSVSFTPTLTDSPTATETATPTLTPTPQKQARPDLSGAYVFPSLYKGSAATRGIWFLGLTSSFTVRLFNLRGEQVYYYSGMSGSGEFMLDLKSQRMTGRITSGVYIYLISSPDGGKKQGKLAIIR